jgi:hypothetical protein
LNIESRRPIETATTLASEFPKKRCANAHARKPNAPQDDPRDGEVKDRESLRPAARNNRPNGDPVIRPPRT